jgi:hypothetical protein
MSCKYDTYDGKGAGGDGAGWYGNTKSGVVRCFGTDYQNQPQDGGFGSAWYNSRNDAEKYLNFNQRPGGSRKRKYSLRRRRGRKHNSRRGGKK